MLYRVELVLWAIVIEGVGLFFVPLLQLTVVTDFCSGQAKGAECDVSSGNHTAPIIIG